MLVFFLPIQAQLPDYHVQVFNERNGLHTFEMRVVLRDEDNFIWILSRDKIQRFDGKQATVFRFDDPLFSIYCDDENRIWTSSRKNIYRYSHDKKGFVTVAHDLPDSAKFSAMQLTQGRPIMILASDGFYSFDSLENKFRKINTGILATKKTFNIFACTAHTNALFGLVNDTIYRFNLVTNTVEGMGLISPNVRKLYALNDHRVLISFWNHNSYWYDFADRTVMRIDLGKKLTGKSSHFFRVESLRQFSQNEYIISSLQGLFLYNIVSDQFKSISLFSEGLPLATTKLFDDVFVDMNNQLLGISQYGLFHFIPDRTHIGLVVNNDKKERVLTNNVRGFAEDEKGNLWIATAAGFGYFDMKTLDITIIKANVDDSTTFNFPSISSIAYDGKYVILGPTAKGLWLYNVKSKTFRRPVYPNGEDGKVIKQKIENDSIDHILTLKNNDHLVSSRDGFYLLDGKNYKLTLINFRGEKDNGNFSFQDSYGNIWLGTDKGLHCFDPDLRYLFQVPEKLGSNKVMCMIELKPGEYLVGTDGVYRMDIRDFKKPGISLLDPSLDKKAAKLFLRDQTNKLWVGTNEGLIRYDLSNKKIDYYDFFDNLNGNGYNLRSCHLTKNGFLLFGGFNGINYLRPESLQNRDEILSTRIMQVIVNKDDSNYIGRAHFKLKHSQNSVEIHFSAPFFSNPYKVKYRYWLKGLDKTWVDNGNNNTIRFTSLSPGSYEFKVAASIDDEHWFEAKEQVAFLLRPPFWKQWWFIALVVVFVSGSVFSLYKYQLNKQLEMERLRSHISRDLHDDIGSTLSSINILSKSSMIQRKENGNNTVVLQKIHQRSQKMLDAMDDLIWNTKPENDSLESLIIRMREYSSEVLEASGISFSLICPDSIYDVKLDMQQKRNLYLIFKEAVNNLAKYSKTNKALIQFDYQKKFLQMKIIDEGVGFSTSIKKGNGLANMQSRAAEMNAQLEIRSVNGHGTTISVQVPV